MRTRHWLTKLLSGALWAALPAVGWSQAPDMGYGPYVNPDMPPGALPAPVYGGVETAGWPQGANQWPYISPYNGPPVDQHKYENGFWFNEKSYGGREYFTYLGATLNEYANPKNDVVGDKNAPLAYTGTTTGNNNNNNNRNRAIFTPRRWTDLEDRLSGGGFRGMAGWFNADDSGVIFDGFWAEEGSAGYSAFDPRIDLSNPVEIERRAADVLLAAAGVPLFDGLSGTLLPITPPDVTAVEVPGGGTQKYDLYYKLGWQSQTYGAGVGYYANPVWSSDSFKVRTMAGMRYLNVRENATFHAADSGLSYTVDPNTLRPTAGSVTGPVDIFESYLRSNTSAHLGGPELGFRVDLGDQKFKIWSQSKLGILANHSTREIDGYGIGRAFVNDLTTTTTVTPLTPTDPNLTRFHQQETTTSVSPTFEQSFFMRAPLLQFVPGVRKIRLFEEAQFQLGYTWLVAGGMYRPGTIIDWRGYPNYPTINSEKTTFYVSSWNFGVEWNF